MAVPPIESQTEGQADNLPLLMDHSENVDHREHTIDILRNNVASSSTSGQDNHDGMDELHHHRGPPAGIPPLSGNSSVTTAANNSRISSFARRADNHGHHQRSPLNSGFWISVELIVDISQIIAAISVLSVSRNEHPRAPLFEWVIGYMVGCIATLPHLYWRYIHCNHQSTEQEPANQDSSQSRTPEPNSYAVISSAHASVEDGTNTTVASRNNFATASPRIHAFVGYFKMALDCFFAVWFVVGSVWIFGGRSSVHDAPNLYRLCIVFLTFSCLGYAMPFILCTMICCCLPCIISIMGFHEDFDQNRGATAEAINALVTYKFKSKRVHDGEGDEDCGGVLAAGTDKERTISGEDAVCCICLAKFANNDDLRELPCMHVFHMECVDKWLKINALCPLCKAEVGGSAGPPAVSFGRRHSDNRVGDDVESQ